MPTNAATDTASGLRYYDWRGQKLLSVTSLRRIVGVPFPLANWMVKQTLEAAFALRNELAVVETEADAERVAKDMRALANEKRDTSASLGTAVHEAAATRVEPEAADPALTPFLQQYYDAEKTLGLDVLLAERQVFNLTLGYAGSFDLIARYNDGKHRRTALVDIKTGSGVYADHLLQLGCYVHGEFVGENDVIDTDATRILHSVDTVAVLHLRPTYWEWLELDPQSLMPGGQSYQAMTALTTLARWLGDNPNIEGQIKRRHLGGTQEV